MKKFRWPKVSIIVSTYNCRDDAKRCFESIIAQDYDKKKVEMIASDSFSTDGTIETLEAMGVKVIKEKTIRPEGVGQAKWFGYKNAKNEILMFIDSDNVLVEKDWIKKMVTPLIKDKTVNFCISRMIVDKNDILVNQYLSLMGTDPFLSYCSADSLLSMGKLELKDDGEYYTYGITLDNFIITGGYSLTLRKKTLDRLGGYSQDIDVSYKLAKEGVARLAIPKDCHTHHFIVRKLSRFLFKKYKLARLYFEQGSKDREFNWNIDSIDEKIKIAIIIYKNLLFFPEFYNGMALHFKTNEKAWLIHAPMMWLTTISYLLAYISKKKNPEQSRYKNQGGV